MDAGINPTKDTGKKRSTTPLFLKTPTDSVVSKGHAWKSITSTDKLKSLSMRIKELKHLIGPSTNDLVMEAKKLTSSDPKKAHDILVRAIIATKQKRKTNKKEKALYEIAELLMQICPEKIIKCVFRIETEDSQSEIIQELAVIQAKIKPVLAIKTIRNIKDPYWNATALHKIANILPKQKEKILNLAAIISKTIKDPYQRAKILLTIAKKQGNTSIKTLHESVEAAKGIKDPYRKTNILCLIAEEQLKIDLKQVASTLTLAGKTAESIEDEILKDLMLSKIAKLQAVYSPVLAVKTANQIKGTYKKITTLSEIADVVSKKNPKQGLVILNLAEENLKLLKVKSTKGRSD